MVTDLFFDRSDSAYTIKTKKNPTGRVPCRKKKYSKVVLSVLSDCIKALSCTENKRNAPDSRKTDQRVNDPADY